MFLMRTTVASGSVARPCALKGQTWLTGRQLHTRSSLDDPGKPVKAEGLIVIINAKNQTISNVGEYKFIWYPCLTQ